MSDTHRLPARYVVRPAGYEMLLAPRRLECSAPPVRHLAEARIVAEPFAGHPVNSAIVECEIEYFTLRLDHVIGRVHEHFQPIALRVTKINRPGIAVIDRIDVIDRMADLVFVIAPQIRNGLDLE